MSIDYHDRITTALEQYRNGWVSERHVRAQVKTALNRGRITSFQADAYRAAIDNERR